MGGPLSGCLANIYLGHLEKVILHFPGLLVYNRYMDDILIISTFSNDQFHVFLQQLIFNLKLSVTSTQNNHSVNFLDVSIAYSSLQRIFTIFPFSKKFSVYPIPSNSMKRNFAIEKNTIISQILRTYRLSSNDKEFTRCVNNFLNYLNQSTFTSKFRKSIFRFLSPVKISTHSWTTDIPYCQVCQHILKKVDAIITKVVLVNNKFISIKKPMNCKTLEIHLLIQSSHGITELEKVDSFHSMVQKETSRLLNSIILPLGQLNDNQVKNILLKHTSIQCHANNISTKRDNPYPCYLHTVYANNKEAYGLPSLAKKSNVIGNYFNRYKKLGRINQ
jgi:hypothetical protein